MAGLQIVITDASPGWVVDLLRLADAIHVLGPLRAGFSAEDGCRLDGRRGVSPSAVIEAAEVRARQVAARSA
jgi:hypothetical protein